MIIPSDYEDAKPEQLVSTLEESVLAIDSRKHLQLASDFNFSLSTCVRTAVDNSRFGSFSGLLDCTVENRVVAAVGPFMPRDIEVLTLMGENGAFPIVSTVLSRLDVDDYLFEPTTNFFSLYPNNLFGGLELIDNGILEQFGWTEVALIMSDTIMARDAVQQFQNIKAISNYRYSIGETVTLPAYDSSTGNTTEALFKEDLKKIRDSGLTVIITSLEEQQEVYNLVFTAASELELLSPQIAWVCLLIPDWLADLDNTTLTDTTLSHMTGILATRINVSADHSQWVVSDNISRDERLANTYDAAWLIALAIREMIYNNSTLEYSYLDETGFQQLLSGQQLMDQLRQVKFQGISGHVNMQKDGTREPRFDLLNLVYRDDQFQFVHVGHWSWEDKLHLAGETLRWYNGSLCTPSGKRDDCRHRLQVLIPRDYDPYIRYHRNRVGNERFSGWAIDAFKFIGKGCVDDNYIFTLWNHTWDEMIVELRKQNSQYDMAVAPIILTKNRLQGVLFTRNIHQVSIGALVLHSNVNGAGLWQFLDPFSWEVWLLCIAFFVFTGIILHLLEKNRDTFPEGAPGWGDAMFVSFSTLTYTQDQDSILTTIGRMYIIVVCFVVLILTSCFTANLTVFLLKTQKNIPFDSVDQLVNEPVGVLKDSGIDYFLQSAANPFSHIKLYRSAEDTVEALKNGTITAFVDDSSVLLEHEVKDQECRLALVPKTWRQVNTGFALRDTPLHDTFASHFNSRVLVAWEEEFFDDLEERYFTSSRSQCSNQDLGGDNRPLDLHNLGGIFVIFGGVTLVCLIGNLIRYYLYKKGILTVDLDRDRPGGHATAQFIKCTVTGASGATSGIPSDAASRKINLYKSDNDVRANHTVSYDQANGHIQLSLTGRNGNISSDAGNLVACNQNTAMSDRKALPNIDT
jgi:ionotropic glutamate receptor